MKEAENPMIEGVKLREYVAFERLDYNLLHSEAEYLANSLARIVKEMNDYCSVRSVGKFIKYRVEELDVLSQRLDKFYIRLGKYAQIKRALEG